MIGLIASIITSIRIQVRVIGALLVREMNTRYGRENIGFLWVIGEPILFCGGVAIAWTAMRPSHDHGLPMTAIVITGYVPLTIWRHCISRGLKAFESNGALLFHRQITPLDIIVARSILEVVGTIAAGLLVALGAMMVGFMEPPVSMGPIYLGLLYQSLFCFACAMLIASLSEVSEFMEKVMGIISYLAIPFSGAFMMVDWAPPSFQKILLWSPSVHNVEMIREGQFGPTANARYDLFYDTWMTALLLIIGLWMTLRIRRYLVIQ